MSRLERERIDVQNYVPVTSEYTESLDVWVVKSTLTVLLLASNIPYGQIG